MSDSTPQVTVNQIAEWLAILVAPDSTVEMRIVFEGKPPIIRHYASTDLPRMARDALRLGRGAKGVYFLLNPLPTEWNGTPATDEDIVQRRWLLVDCDPKRKGTVSSTDAEKSLAEAKAKAVHAFLKELGWPRPIIADSGNGWHLLYRIDLPGKDEKLVWRVLKVLDQRFSDGAVDIDVTVGNASRICKLYGTVAAKSENTPERPHRVSKIVRIPQSLDLVPTEQLQKLAGELKQPPAPATRRASRADTGGRPDIGGRPSRPEAIERASKYLATMDPSVEGEHGHDKLLRAASVLVNDFELNNAEAFDLLASDFNLGCVPPWDESELRRKVAEAKKNPPTRSPKGLTDGNILNGETTAIVDEPWPEPLGEIAFHGVAGDIVRKIAPHTEADPVAILIQLLVALGNVIGRHCYFSVEATRHYANLFAVIVGSSSTGRKGTAGDHVKRLIESVDPDWSLNRVIGGLVSGEGLVWQVRDPITKKQPLRDSGKPPRVTGYEEVVIDEGILDKRLLTFETEFSSLLKAKSRDGNSLSETLRQAWDSGRLRTAAKNSPAKATDAHTSLIGHITCEELRYESHQGDMTNGLANRFLWCCVKRSQLLPEGGQIHTVDFGPEIETLKGVVKFATLDREIVRDAEAAAEWRQLYSELSKDRPGALGAVCNRGAAQVVRLSLLYALLDKSPVISVKHLRAAGELWRYCEASVTHVFGHSLADRTADTIFRALNSNGTNGLSRTAISDLFKRNKSKSDLDGALQKLHSAKLARRETIGTGGRPTEVWYATG